MGFFLKGTPRYSILYPMTKQTNTVCKSTRKMAQSRLSYLQSMLSGERGFSGSKRLRSYRVEATLSVRNAIRLESFLADIVNDKMISRKTYNRLSREIPEFTQIVSPTLINQIEASI